LLVLYAAPSFWVALVLQNLLAVRWRLLPLYGRTPPGDGASILVHLEHLLLPALCLALHQLAFFARLARNSAIAGWQSTHALCARAAGVPDGRVFLRHAIRPALVPLAAQLGLLVPAFVGGTVLMENIFSWPGVGVLLLSGVLSRDYPVVLGFAVLAGVLTVTGSLLADVLAQFADPRLRSAPEI
jgi:peptide/nickel transport system permease protein